MKADLKSRIPIAIVYVAMVIGSLLAGQISSILLISVFFLCCIYEFISISKNANIPRDYLPYYLLIGILAFLPFDQLLPLAGRAILYGTLFYMILNGLYVVFKSRVLFVHQSMMLNIIPYLIMPFLIAIYMLKSVEQFNYITLCVFVLIWLNDTGAYFVGSTMGKRKLHPKISPKKTWEGLFGGGICTILGGIAIANYYAYFNLSVWILIAIAVWIFAVLGDMSESAWKRFYGVKDTGTILQGHGGFLDRLDSFIYTIPIIAFILYHTSNS